MYENAIKNQQLQLLQRGLTLQWVSSNSWFATKGYEIWFSNDEGKSWNKRSKVKAGIIPWCSTSPFIAQAGRLGIQNLIRLTSGTILCIADGVVFRSTDMGLSFAPIFSDFTGRRPLRMGLCQDNCGRIYLGEYFFNRQREPVHLWRSDDDALNWFLVHTWPSGKIRHIHLIQYDPFDQSVWLGTGDEDGECQLAYSCDGGVSFKIVGAGKQIWRACSLLFTSEAIFWGTDIGEDQHDQPNYVIRLDRRTGEITKIQPTEGPTYYSTHLIDGTLVIGTCVEEANYHNVKRLHLLWTKDENNWNDLRLWPRLMMPGIVGTATITFPLSDAPLKTLLFNVNLTQKYNGSLFELKI